MRAALGRLSLKLSLVLDLVSCSALSPACVRIPVGLRLVSVRTLCLSVRDLVKVLCLTILWKLLTCALTLQDVMCLVSLCFRGCRLSVACCLTCGVVTVHGTTLISWLRVVGCVIRMLV